MWPKVPQRGLCFDPKCSIPNLVEFSVMEGRPYGVGGNKTDFGVTLEFASEVPHLYSLQHLLLPLHFKFLSQALIMCRFFHTKQFSSS